MRDDNGIIPRSPSENAAISDVVLHVADDGTFGNRSERQYISDDEISLLSAVYKLSSIHSLGGDEELLLVLEAEGVAEGNAGERGATAGVVDDIGDDTLEVAVPLAEVEGAEACRPLAVVGVRLEDGARSLTLSTNHTSHCVCVCEGEEWRNTIRRRGDEIRVLLAEVGFGFHL